MPTVCLGFNVIKGDNFIIIIVAVFWSNLFLRLEKPWNMSLSQYSHNSHCDGTWQSGVISFLCLTSSIYNIAHMKTCESAAQWLACSIEEEGLQVSKSGGSSQCMLVDVPLAVRTRSWMRQTQRPLLWTEGGWASGSAPCFRLRVPAQSTLLCASLKTNLYLCGLPEIVTAANLCVHFSQHRWKPAAVSE